MSLSYTQGNIMQLFYLKQLQDHFDGTLTCNGENVASFIPTTHTKYLFLHYVTWVEQVQSPVRNSSYWAITLLLRTCRWV